jgi:hypothetical protein
MRRTASEILSDLEVRVARLERDHINSRREKMAGARVDLYKLLKEYNELKGDPRHPDVEHIKRVYDLDLIEEEIRRVHDWIQDIQHFEPRRRREDKKEMLRQRIKNKEHMENSKALYMQDLEDRMRRGDLERMRRKERRRKRTIDL